MISKHSFLILPLLAISFFVSSCASTSKAPESKSDEAKIMQAPFDRGTVFLYRTGRVVGAGGQIQVTINSDAAGGTGPGTFFRWDLLPGTYTFSSSTSESSAIVKLDVVAGQVYYLRQDARIGINSGRVTIEEVDSKKGENEVKNCKLLVSSYVPQ